MLELLKNALLWLYEHAAGITTIGFGGYTVYRLWDDRRSRLDFTAFTKDYLPWLKIFNLGEVPVLVLEVRVVLYGHGEENRFPVNAQLKGSDTLEVAVPPELLHEVFLTVDIEMAVCYRTRHGREAWTKARGFNLVGGEGRFALKSGFDAVRDVRCLTCGDLIPMIASRLKNEEEVSKHRKKFEKYLRRKCPNHLPILELRTQREKKRADSTVR